MTGTRMKRVYVVNEGCPVQQQLEDRLRQHHIRPLWFTTARQCLETRVEWSCGPLVIGLDGASETGIELVTRWHRMYPLPPVIAVVNKGDVPLAAKAVKAGACDCVERPLSNEWWLTALVEMLTGSLDSPDSNSVLTETEKLVLSQIVEGRTSKEIGVVLHRSTRTVEVHRKNILRKLGLSSTVDLIRRAVAAGGLPGRCDTDYSPRCR